MERKDLTAIIGPMPEEVEGLIKLIDNRVEHHWHQFVFHSGKLYGKDVIVVKSGIGKVFAAMMAQRLIDQYNPSRILLTGVAGALSKELNIGDLVIGQDFVQHDMSAEELGFKRGQIPYTNLHIFPADEDFFSLARTFHPKTHKVFTGRILSGDQFLTKREIESFAYLTGELEGDVVEMEAAAIAQVCHVNNNLPFLAVKTISDKADGNAAVDFNKFMPTVVDNTLQITEHILKRL